MVEDTKSMISCLFLGAPQKFLLLLLLLLLLFVVTASDDDELKRRVEEAEGLNNDDCCCRSVNVNDMNANAVVGTVMMPVEARRYVLLIANLSFGSLL